MLNKRKLTYSNGTVVEVEVDDRESLEHTAYWVTEKKVNAGKLNGKPHSVTVHGENFRNYIIMPLKYKDHIDVSTDIPEYRKTGT